MVIENNQASLPFLMNGVLLGAFAEDMPRFWISMLSFFCYL